MLSLLYQAKIVNGVGHSASNWSKIPHRGVFSETYPGTLNLQVVIDIEEKFWLKTMYPSYLFEAGAPLEGKTWRGAGYIPAWLKNNSLDAEGFVLKLYDKYGNHWGGRNHYEFISKVNIREGLSLGPDQKVTLNIV